VLPIWAVLPASIALIFTLIYGFDRARGGYRIEKLHRLGDV
jgi:hypothetical protein